MDNKKIIKHILNATPKKYTFWNTDIGFKLFGIFLLLILLICSFQYAKVSNKYSIYNIEVSGNSFVNNDFIKSVVQKNINNNQLDMYILYFVFISVYIIV